MRAPLLVSTAFGLVLLGGASLAAAAPAPKTAQSTARGKVKTRPAKLRRTIGGARIDRKGTALLAQLVVAYANGEQTGLVGGVQKRVGRSKAQVAAAVRLAGGLSRGKFDAAAGAPTKAQFEAVLRRAAPYAPVSEYLGVEVLPAEAVPVPSDYTLKLAGLRATSVDDPDGTDAMKLWVATVRMQGSTYTSSTEVLPRAGAYDVKAGGVEATSAAILSGVDPKPYLLITAVVDDDADGAKRLEELDLLLALSIDVSTQVGGSDPFQTLQAMFSYSAGVVELSGGASAHTAVEATVIGADDWHAIYSTPAQEAGGAHYKLAIPHTVGKKGKVDVLFDVPSVIPPRARLTAKIDRVSVVPGTFGSPGAVAQQLLQVCIGDACTTLQSEVGEELRNVKVLRDVVHGPTRVRFSLFVRTRLAHDRKVRDDGSVWECGEEAGLQPCAWQLHGHLKPTPLVEVDLDPSVDSEASFAYDTRSLPRAAGVDLSSQGSSDRPSALLEVNLRDDNDSTAPTPTPAAKKAATTTRPSGTLPKL